MKLHPARSMSDYTPPGITRWVHLAERAVAQLERMDGDVEVRIGQPSFRFGISTETVRAELQRQLEDARSLPAWRGVTR